MRSVSFNTVLYDILGQPDQGFPYWFRANMLVDENGSRMNICAILPLLDVDRQILNRNVLDGAKRIAADTP